MAAYVLSARKSRRNMGNKTRHVNTILPHRRSGNIIKLACRMPPRSHGADDNSAPSFTGLAKGHHGDVISSAADDYAGFGRHIITVTKAHHHVVAACRLVTMRCLSRGADRMLNTSGREIRLTAASACNADQVSI